MAYSQHLLKYIFCSSFRFLQNHSVNHALLIESPFIIRSRENYLRKMNQYKSENRNIYFLDESYINSHYSPTKILTDTTVHSAKDAQNRGLTTGIPRVSGKGPRVILLGMGSADGFVKGAAQVLKHTKKEVTSEDYHQDITADKFEPWLGEQLTKIPKGSVIVSTFDLILIPFRSFFHSLKIKIDTLNEE